MLKPKPRFQKKLLLLNLFLVISHSAQATEWKIDGGLNQTLGYDDNMVMRKKPVGMFEYFLIPTLNFRRNDDDLKINGSLSYGLKEYSYSAYNNSPQNYNTGITYRTSQITWGLNAAYSEQLSNSMAATDTGNFSSTATSIGQSISPSISYMLDSINSLSLSGSYAESEYQRSSGFTNSITKSSSLGWNHIWNDRLSQSITGSFSRSDFKSVSERVSDTYSINVGLKYKLSQQWSADSSIGERYTDQSTINGQSGNSTSMGWSTNIALNYKGKSSTASWGGVRSTTPTGQGVLSQQTSVFTNYSYSFTDRWSASISGSYMMSDAVGQNTIVNSVSTSRSNFNIQPRLSWRMDRDADISLYYLYKQQDSNFSATSKALMLTFNYNWSGFNISR